MSEINCFCSRDLLSRGHVHCPSAYHGPETLTLAQKLTLYPSEPQPDDLVLSGGPRGGVVVGMNSQQQAFWQHDARKGAWHVSESMQTIVLFPEGSIIIQ